MTAFPITTLNDAPDTLTLSASGARARVQVAKLGKFKDPRYGNFSITLDHFAKWKENFKLLHGGEGKVGMPVDRDHLPEKRGETEAVGWITALDNMGQDGKTSTPDELWAAVEFNSLGQELVKDKRYAYISPTYHPNYADEGGRTYGTTMVGVALTNRPFLDMACISLSHAGTAVMETTSDSPRQMPTLNVTKELLTALGVAEDKVPTILDAADPAAALAAATAAKPTPTVTSPAPGDIDLKQLAKDQGLVVIDATTLTTLTAQAASGAAVAVELAATKFDTAFTGAVNKGSVLPAAKPTFELAYEHDPEGTLKMLTDLPAVVNVTAQGSGARPSVAAGASALAREVGDEKGWEVDDERDELHRKALSLSQEHNISYDEAIDRVMVEG